MDEDHDPEWVALLAAVRARPPLVRAVEVLSRRHDLDEAGAVRRLMWEAVAGGTGLAEAARTVVETDRAG